MIDNKDQFDVLRKVTKNPDASQRELANESGISLGKINYCISALIDIGYVKIKNFTSSNKKINYVYILTPEGIKNKTIITKNFLTKKKVEYDRLLSYLDN